MSVEKKVKKPSEYKKGDSVGEGSKLKKSYFFDDKLHYLIYLDFDNRVRYRVGEKVVDCLNELEKLSSVDGELLLLNRFFKSDFNLKMAYIYKLALNNEKENAKKEIDILL